MNNQYSHQFLAPDDKDWQDFINTCKSANIFHHPVWVKLLSECYRYPSTILAIRDQNDSLAAGIPFLKINSPITGKRWVALPFSDYCRPLFTDPAALNELVTWMVQLFHSRFTHQIEVRWALPEGLHFTGTTGFVLHTIQLCPDIEQLAKQIKRTHLQNIHSAENRGVTVIHGRELIHMEEFYRLQIETRKRHGIPVQPWRYFRSLWEKVIAQDYGFILLAHKDNEYLAGMVYLHWNDTLIAKYAASREDRLNLRPNNLLFWEGIRWGCETGYSRFDMGRTELINEGLRNFKNRWGSIEEPLIYSRLSRKSSNPSTGKLANLLHRFIQNSPDWVCQATGEVFIATLGSQYYKDAPAMNLWGNNTPNKFWLTIPKIEDDIWLAAIFRAIPTLGLPIKGDGIENLLIDTLGEGQFGNNHWKITPIKRLYYHVKPWLPNPIKRTIHTRYSSIIKKQFRLSWPIEPRYVNFLFDTLRYLLLTIGLQEINIRPIWPGGYRFAMVLTHDIDSKKGQDQALELAEFEERLGFTSSFNFVPELYPLDFGVIKELRQRGFEVGVHGLKHDGKLFSSRRVFHNRAGKINDYLKKMAAVGYRSPLTHRNPYWMQELAIDYDLSFFDTDPYEPVPGGVMSIWPFQIGHFIELPYTLTQDRTLINVIGETSPRIWLQKVKYIKEHFGMALVNYHPDDWHDPKSRYIYSSYLQFLRESNQYWHTLPSKISQWWRIRMEEQLSDDEIWKVFLSSSEIQVEP